MNLRELASISTAALFGAGVSAIAIRLFFVSPSSTNTSRKHYSSADKKIGPQCPFDPSKRKGMNISWQLHFYPPSVQRILIGIGYNGFPRGCSDDSLPWSKKSKTGNPLETKYPYVCHAEVNAILNTNHASAAGQRLYVTMFPCNECAMIIILSGVSEVIYFVEKRLNNSDTAYAASHKLLTLAGVKVRKHQPKMDKISISFEEP